MSLYPRSMHGEQLPKDDEKKDSAELAAVVNDTTAATPERQAHTPGPWHFVPSNVGAVPDHGYALLYGEPDYFGWEKNLFVMVGCSHRAATALGRGVPEANAHLIAAAPDLLAACKALKSQLESVRDVYLGNGDAEDYKAIDDAHKAIAKAEGRS